jgi:membrane-bound lytic murein transglycosylase D
VSDLLGLTDEELRRYNPELSKPTIPYKGTGYELNIPEGYSEVFYNNVEGMLVSSKEAYEKERIEEAKRPKVVYHYVRKGECLPIIARRHGCTVSQLKKWNGIRGSIIYPKQKLKIYRS